MRSMTESERVFATLVGVRGVGRGTSWLSMLANEPRGVDVLDSVAVRRSMRLATLVDGFGGLVRSSFAAVKQKRPDKSFAPFTEDGEAGHVELEISGSVSERVRGLELFGFKLAGPPLVEVADFPTLPSDTEGDKACSLPTGSRNLDATHPLN